MFRLLRVLFIVFMIITVIICVFYIKEHSRSALQVPNHIVCVRNLESIYYYLNLIKDSTGFYPISFKIDENGRNLSWRYLIARKDIEIHHNTIKKFPESYYRWDLTYPWLDEHNKEQVAYPKVTCYDDLRLSHEQDGQKITRYGDTSYLMLLRNGKTIEELPPLAVIIVESADCGIHWMEPKDLEIEAIELSESPFGHGKLNSYHKDYVNALRKDGKVIRIFKTFNKKKVLAILNGEINE